MRQLLFSLSGFKFFVSVALMIACALNASIIAAQETQTANQIENQQGDFEQGPRTWQICNETSFILNTAIASVHSGFSNNISVRGWNRIMAGDCQTIKVSQGAPRYVYARSDLRHQGGTREWKGRHEFCIAPPIGHKKMLNTFKAKSDIACDLQNMQSANFLRILPTEERTAFVEPQNFGSNAGIAGMQRLLQDNHYDIKRVDGVTGRRTSNTMKKFIKDNKLAKNLSYVEKIKALSKAAFEGQKTRGVEFCNQTSNKIWTAIAAKTPTHWESRGWWPVERKTCIRPFTKNLKNENMFVYARLETSDGPDLVLNKLPNAASTQGRTKTKTFCISQSSFAAVAHEYCEDQGYIAANFSSISNKPNGLSLKLTDEHFSKTSLRRGQ